MNLKSNLHLSNKHSGVKSAIFCVWSISTSFIHAMLCLCLCFVLTLFEPPVNQVNMVVTVKCFHTFTSSSKLVMCFSKSLISHSSFLVSFEEQTWSSLCENLYCFQSSIGYKSSSSSSHYFFLLLINSCHIRTACGMFVFDFTIKMFVVPSISLWLITTSTPSGMTCECTGLQCIQQPFRKRKGFLRHFLLVF